MREHVQVVAWLHLALGALGVLTGLFVFGVLGAAGLMSGEAEGGAALGLVGVVIAGIATLLSVPALVGGWGLLQRRPWARVLVLVLSVLNLLNFPLGTLIGGYSIWVLMQDEARAMF